MASTQPTISKESKELLRKLKIKASSLKRIHKEFLAYQKEETTQQEHIEQMKRDQKDEYDIKKQLEVLQETQQIIPNTLQRLSNARQELLDHLVRIERKKERRENKIN